MSAAAGKAAVDVVVIMHGEAKLLQVVGALHAVGGFPDLLHRRQQQTDQNGNDGDHDEQLNEREAPP